jgi:hypothetical protein
MEQSDPAFRLPVSKKAVREAVLEGLRSGEGCVLSCRERSEFRTVP